MLCLSLQKVPTPSFPTSFDFIGLQHGAKAFNEPYIRHDIQGLSIFDLADHHLGMDASINQMLEGGNGWAPCMDYDTPYGQGIVQEVRDMRALRAWQFDLGQCMADKQRGATA